MKRRQKKSKAINHFEDDPIPIIPSSTFLKQHRKEVLDAIEATSTLMAPLRKSTKRTQVKEISMMMHSVWLKLQMMMGMMQILKLKQFRILSAMR